MKFILQQREKRRSGEWQAHYDKDGVRYEKAALERKLVCAYCAEMFVAGRIRYDTPFCEGCRDTHREVMRLKKVERVKNTYAKDPLAVSIRRLGYWLKNHGLSLEWYNNLEKKCGICGATDPGGRGGGRGGWCIDHDHSCCPYQGVCPKCVRGLLCTNCNTGLGHFKDDPLRLQAAIEWVKRSRPQPTPPP